MYFPALRSLDCRANPGGPRWANVRLAAGELDYILWRMAMIVAWDDRRGEARVLGSGFLVGTQPDLIALTATHVLTEWADKARPPGPHAFSGLQGDEDDLRRRLDELVQKNLIRVIVRCGPAGRSCMCQVGALTFTAHPRDIDVASITLRRPTEALPFEFHAFAIDVEPNRWDGEVLIAGFAEGSSWTPPPDDQNTFDLKQNLVVRAGYCRGRIAEPPGYRCPMYQLNMPSVAGMSGGPVLALRSETGERPRIISPEFVVQPTAIGIVSRDCIAPTVLIDGSDPGETWAAPIEDAYLLRLGWRDKSVYFGEVVRDGRIQSFGPRACTASIIDRPDGRVDLHFGLPDA
jgi:hypothetical protein